MGRKFEGSTFKSAAKVSILDEYTDIYTDILGSKWPEKLWYIETHAGTGVIDTGDYEIDGSILTILSNYSDDFSRYYFFEKRTAHFEELVNQLEERFGWDFDVSPLKPTEKDFDVARLDRPYIRVMNADCNDNATFLAENSNPENHWLVFIDQAGPSVKLDTVEAFLDRGNMDMLLTFPTSGIHRSAGSEHSRPRVDDHYGGDWTKDASMEERVQEFVEKLEERQELKPIVTRDLKWRQNPQQRFDLVFASESEVARKKARGRMKQEEIWEKARERLGLGNIDSWS